MGVLDALKKKNEKINFEQEEQIKQIKQNIDNSKLDDEHYVLIEYRIRYKEELQALYDFMTYCLDKFGSVPFVRVEKCDVEETEVVNVEERMDIPEPPKKR